MKICYVTKKFSAEHEAIIDRANSIIQDFHAQGYDLTLRQLYYQFVSKDWLANTDKNYKRLGDIVSAARRAGRIDWDRIVDRTRFLRTSPAWGGPEEIVAACAEQFSVDFWANQPYRPEVWVEKDALVGVLEVACRPWHCPYFSCRGYTSDSEIWSAARRMSAYVKKDQTPIVFHLGDHDPSGVDMSRDIADRINLFAEGVHKIEIKRIALTMDQIEEYNPPPNPAKTTDARYTKYQELHGDQSWELDALSPTTLSELIAQEMGEIIDQEKWDESVELRTEGRRLLKAVSDDWDNLTDGL